VTKNGPQEGANGMKLTTTTMKTFYAKSIMTTISYYIYTYTVPHLKSLSKKQGKLKKNRLRPSILTIKPLPLHETGDSLHKGSQG